MRAADEIHRLSSTLWHWQAYSPQVKCDMSSTAVLTPEGLVFIDPIPLAKDALEELLSCGEPAAILLTSANHARAALDFKKRLRVKIYAPAAAKPELEIAADSWLEPGQLAPGGLQQVDLTGGALGETAYLASGVLCVGDALIHLESHGFAMLPEKYCKNPRELTNNLRKTLSHDFQAMTFAHGTPILSGARARLAALLS